MLSDMARVRLLRSPAELYYGLRRFLERRLGAFIWKYGGRCGVIMSVLLDCSLTMSLFLVYRLGD